MNAVTCTTEGNFVWIALITHAIFTLLNTVLHVSAIIFKNPWMTLAWLFLTLTKCYFDIPMIIFIYLWIVAIINQYYWWLAIIFMFQSLYSLATMLMTMKDQSLYAEVMAFKVHAPRG